MKKKYYKLKDGSFINLEENQDLEFIDKMMSGMDINYKQLENGEIKIPVNRTLYLNQLLKTVTDTQIVRNGEYKKIVNELDKENGDADIQIPAVVENTLRYYQKTGYKWLKTLDNYKFGGILADDMGLGKTVQMLSIVAGYVEQESQRRTSIVICPSSLTLNWQNEAQKFTNGLQTLVIRGNAEERRELIQKIDNYDIIITSYPLTVNNVSVTFFLFLHLFFRNIFSPPKLLYIFIIPHLRVIFKTFFAFNYF